MATISDAHLALYQVHIAKADSVDLANIAADNPNFTLIGQGSSAVTNGKVATFDPTTLANDSYVIRVRAIDAGGLITAEAVTVNVNANAKLGQFSLEFTDLSVPLVGIPIQVLRQYDSLHANEQGDFGFGWKLGFVDGDIRTQLPIVARRF